MAHKKGEGKVKNGRDSHSKRLGLKIFGGDTANPGNIIARQRGTTYHPGKGVMIGKDHTIFATISGVSGSTYTVSAISMSVCMVAGLLFTSIVSIPSSMRDLQA